ncbi:MAG: STAS/SEC14 domain-containing protein [Bacteroidetes bacterium]|nr:STAS/SEC14 domain-containing protein [Bacteroidota bacterium]MBL6942955.1 STAS/SEC14 domain-containing protein [Bacteroidales bacterium]
MIKILDSTSEKVIAIEIIGGYESKDEKSLVSMFDEKLAAGINKVNMLIKIDKLSLTKSSCKAMWDDGIFALEHFKHCGHIAVVGDSKVEEFLIKSDNVFYKSGKAGRVEKYFNVANLDKAMSWINE